MSHATPNIKDGPAWDFGMVIRGVELRFVSPLEIKSDLPPMPTLEQAEIDRATRRRAGIFKRSWWWLFGEPGITRDQLPQDGGAAHVRMLVGAMVHAGHDEFLASLTTGEIFQIHQTYMGYQDAWGEALHAWAAEQARKAMPSPSASAEPAQGVHGAQGGTVLKPGQMRAQVEQLLGKPRKGTVPHLTGDHTTNGSVERPGGNPE